MSPVVTPGPHGTVPLMQCLGRTTTGLAALGVHNSYPLAPRRQLHLICVPAQRLCVMLSPVIQGDGFHVHGFDFWCCGCFLSSHVSR